MKSVKEGIKSQTIEAVITRADGTKEYLGVISFWHRNPFIRWGWKIKKIILEFVKRYRG